MINSILIANRGEIACRIARTAKFMGIESVAVYSEPDANSLHVQQADRALAIGGHQPADSYLNAEKIIRLANSAGIDAIHPGYGFLSENADFARLCAKHGLIFIGPSPESIETMGSKSAAKRLMQQADVPLVPGYHGDEQSIEVFSRSAQECGYPVILKASAGGGGKGMRIVRAENELESALVAVKRESKSSFGDEHVLIEKYLVEPRHIEIQVFGDTLGNYVHLFERDCSIQRRHQKVLEEAPAPDLSDSQRTAMGIAAIEAAKAIDYIGAGTIEFIADQLGNFYFMEMNTRLQVEHPVTEMITGQDLVEWQIRVAQGEPLPIQQADLTCSGHSVEARLYAENTENGFLPISGEVSLLNFPPEHRSLRIESGVKTGDVISTHYDPMIAKVVAHGPTREIATTRLLNALDQIDLLGLTNNISFLKRVLASDAFTAASLTTSFIDSNLSALTAPVVQTDELHFAAALAALLKANTIASSEGAWARNDGWRLNSAAATVVSIKALDSSYASMSEQPLRLSVHRFKTHWTISVADLQWQIQDLTIQRVSDSEAVWRLNCCELVGGNTRPIEARILHRENLFSLRLTSSTHLESPSIETTEYYFELVDQDGHQYAGDGGIGTLLAPMPGKILSIMASQGQKVETEQPLMILEAMKMEHTITAPTAGLVTDIFYQTGDTVEAQSQLLAITPDDEH